MLLKVFCVLVVVFSSQADEPLRGRPCTKSERGTPKIMYYMDQDRLRGYPFKYHGCGETNGVEKANDLPMIMDAFVCDGFYNSKNICLHSADPTLNCSSTENCYMGAFFGHCCDKAIEKRYAKNREAFCEFGTVPHKASGEIVFGRNCTHDFCPNNSKCVDGEFEAYCCKK